MPRAHWCGFLLLVLGWGLGCGGDDLRPGNIESFRVEPADVELLVRDGVSASQDYRLYAVTKSGKEVDVTADAVFTVDDPDIGTFAAEVLTVGGNQAGRATVTGSVELLGEGSTNVFVRVQRTRVADGAPSDAPDQFANGGEDPAVDPSIVYPDNLTVMPPNIGDFEVHWLSGAGTVTAYELSLRAAYLDIVVYLPPHTDWSAFTPQEWYIAGQTQAGGKVEAVVRSVTDDGRIGRSGVDVFLTPDPIEGGIYYWATENSEGAAQGIIRHDVSRPGQDPEALYTTTETPGGRCVGCHALSRDGRRMAVRYDGSIDNDGGVLDVETGSLLVYEQGTYRWNFSAFEPNGERVAYITPGGVLTLLEVDTEITTPIATTGKVTMPDFSPDGTKLLYVRYNDGTNPIYMSDGSIVTRSYDEATGSAGAESVLVPSEAMNVYYPTWSPDGEWVLFNKSTGDSYDDGDAELWVVKADGSVPPIRLDTVNKDDGNFTDSWARWAPFEQISPTFEGGTEPLFWLTWSSKREFGVRLPTPGRPQLWMAPFFPLRALQGVDPTAPAFRLPFQDIDSSNHIAQWTERVVTGIE